MELFIDIETVPVHAEYAQLPTEFKIHWEKKMQYLRLKDHERNDPEIAYYGHAGIFAEWSKVICIGLGYFSKKEKDLKTSAIYGDDEIEILTNFKSVLAGFREFTDIIFCGHNIKEFDLPFLCRRMRIHQIPLPDELQLAGLKPWENLHVDTMDMWRFGERKRFTSLDLLAHALGETSSKTDMDGSQVAQEYYKEKNLDKIVDYCKRDVITTAAVYNRLKA